jgi:hypothetical protein
MQLELVQSFRSRGAAEAVDLLAVDAKDIVQMVALRNLEKDKIGLLSV